MMAAVSCIMSPFSKLDLDTLAGQTLDIFPYRSCALYTFTSRVYFFWLLYLPDLFVLVDFTEFKELMTHELSGDRGTDPREIIESFRIFDEARNGMISTGVFKKIMSQMGEKLPEAQVDAMIKMANPDDDGNINYERFTQMVSGASVNKGLL